jgi:hypothetical protein
VYSLLIGVPLGFLPSGKQKLISFASVQYLRFTDLDLEQRLIFLTFLDQFFPPKKTADF